MTNNIIYIYINEDSKYYQQALELRYNALYKNFALPRTCVIDHMEPKSFHIIAIDNGKVVGYSRLTKIDEKSSQITQVAVDENYRGQDIGKNLCEKLILRANEYSEKLVFLNARMTAVDFYKKLGFVGVSDIFISEKTRIPHMKMERKLD